MSLVESLRHRKEKLFSWEGDKQESGKFMHTWNDENIIWTNLSPMGSWESLTTQLSSPFTVFDVQSCVGSPGLPDAHSGPRALFRAHLLTEIKVLWVNEIDKKHFSEYLSLEPQIRGKEKILLVLDIR